MPVGRQATFELTAGLRSDTWIRRSEYGTLANLSPHQCPVSLLGVSGRPR